MLAFIKIILILKKYSCSIFLLY
uniref:Uncharacterized protein n=1 Tax=Anguilla anguilla TaxID=7936 RepID=A0A0E9UL37_ANGAN